MRNKFKKSKAVLSFLVIASMLASSFSFVYAKEKPLTADSDTAVIKIGKEVETVGVKSVVLGTNTSPKVVTRGGYESWEINKNVSNSQKLDIVLSDEFKSAEFDGTEYTVEVDYFDKGKSYFHIYYDDKEFHKNWTDYTHTNAEDVWKTATYVLDDAAFAGGLDGGIDLSISTVTPASSNRAACGPIPIKEIRIKKTPKKNNIFFTARTDRPGNCFEWYKEEKYINNTIENLNDAEMTADVTHSLVSWEGTVVLEKQETITLAPGEVKEAKFDFSEVKRCDLYKYYVEVAADGQKGSKRLLTELAILKTDPDGIKNEEMYYGTNVDSMLTNRTWITYFDKMGNETEVYGKGGVYTFNASFDPIYIVGNFRKTEILTQNKTLEFVSTQKSVPSKDIATIAIKSSLSEPLTVEVSDLHADARVNSVSFDKKTSTYNVEILNEAAVDSEYHPVFKVYDQSGKCISVFDIPFKSTCPVEPELSFSLPDTGNLNNWIASIKLKNLSATNPLKGTFEFLSPGDLTSKKPIDFGVITTERTGGLDISLPSVGKKGRQVASYKITLDNGEVYEYTQQFDTTIAMYAHTNPRIDGVIERGEWAMGSAMYTGTDMGHALKARMEQGFTFLKMDLGIEHLLDEPGCLNAPLGMLEDIKKYSMKAIMHQGGSIDMDMMLGKNYETFTIPHHATGIHLTQKGMDYLEDYVRQVREVIGHEVPLAIDHFGHICIEDCIMFAKRLEKYNIAWIEDIAPWHYTKHYEKIAHATNVPICTGEDIYLAENYEPLMACGGVSVVHPDMLTVGGAMELKKLGNMCDKYGVAMAIHMAESPIAMMAAIHAAAAVQNVLAVEFHSIDIPWWNDLANGIANPLFNNGFIDVPNTPGLGIDSLNEELIAEHMHEKYPEQWGDTSIWDNEWANDREWS